MNNYCGVYALVRTMFFSFVSFYMLIDTTAFAQSVGSAALTVSIKSDSERVNARHYRVLSYENTQCKKPKKGHRVAKKKYADLQHTFPKIEIDANDSYLFQINYSDNQRTVKRSCSYLVEFSPKPDSEYFAELEVSGDVSSCRISFSEIIDGELSPVNFKEPQNSCLRPGKVGVKNGSPIQEVLSRF